MAKVSVTAYDYKSGEWERCRLNRIIKLKGKFPVDDDYEDALIKKCVLYAAQRNQHQLIFQNICRDSLAVRMPFSTTVTNVLARNRGSKYWFS